MSKKKLMIVGGGNLCLQVLQILAPRNAFDFYVAGRDAERTLRLCNLVRLAASQLGQEIRIEPVTMNLVEQAVERNTETLHRLRPDIILNCASLQSWRVITQLPKECFEHLDKAQLGPWLPMHLAPAWALMRAVHGAGIRNQLFPGLGERTVVINAAFPDAVNPVLDKLGMAPDAGIGNIANLVPATRAAIAALLRQNIQAVKVKLVGQHYFSHYVPRGGLPTNANYHLCYWVWNGKFYEERTGEVSDQAIFEQVASQFRRLGGVDGQYLTAASAVSVVENLHAVDEVEAHVPGIRGLPGGYPVRVGLGGVRLSLPYGITREDAIATNLRGQRQDGIDMIHPDGRVSFGSSHMAIMEGVLGYHRSAMKVSEVAECADELGRKYREYVSRIRSQGVNSHAAKLARSSAA